MSKIISVSVLIDFNDGRRPQATILIVAGDSEDDALDFVRLKKDDARWTQDARRARHVEVSDEDLRLRILARFAEASPQCRCLCILCSTDGMEAAEDIDRAVTCFACPCGEISCPVRVLPIRRC